MVEALVGREKKKKELKIFLIYSILDQRVCIWTSKSFHYYNLTNGTRCLRKKQCFDGVSLEESDEFYAL